MSCNIMFVYVTIYKCICIYIEVYTYVYLYIYAYIYIYVCILCKYIYVCIYMYVYMYIYTHVSVYLYYLYIYIIIIHVLQDLRPPLKCCDTTTSMRSWISSRASCWCFTREKWLTSTASKWQNMGIPLVQNCHKIWPLHVILFPQDLEKYKKSTIPRSNPDFCTHPQKSDPTIDTFALNIHICRFPEIGVVPPNHPFWMILSIIYHLLWGYVPPFMETSTSVGSNMGTRVPHLVGGFNTSEKYESQLG